MKAHLLAAFTVFVWDITFVSTKVLLVDFSPMHILFIRFALGFIALCCLRPAACRYSSDATSGSSRSPGLQASPALSSWKTWPWCSRAPLPWVSLLPLPRS